MRQHGVQSKKMNQARVSGLDSFNSLTPRSGLTAYTWGFILKPAHAGLLIFFSLRYQFNLRDGLLLFSATAAHLLDLRLEDFEVKLQEDSALVVELDALVEILAR